MKKEILLSLLGCMDWDKRIILARKLDIEDLIYMIDDDNFLVREEVAKRIDESEVYKMATDTDEIVRLIVASRTDMDGLYLMMKDPSHNVKEIVASRIDAYGLYLMGNDGDCYISNSYLLANLKYQLEVIFKEMVKIQF